MDFWKLHLSEYNGLLQKKTWVKCKIYSNKRDKDEYSNKRDKDEYHTDKF